MSPLEAIAAVDGITPGEAAAVFVASGLSSVSEWESLGTSGRAAIFFAKKEAEFLAMAAAGQDIAAARLMAPLDGGWLVTRLVAKAAADGAARFLREKGA